MDQFHDSPGQDCPSDTQLLRIIFQGKWRLRVLREIAKGPVRLSQLRRAVPECSKKVLIDTLHGLEGLGWIGRQEFPAKLRRVEYSLTRKCEQDVRRAIAIASSEADGQRPRQS
jgi:DNA-binding HxlR family transcriptional regulator